MRQPNEKCDEALRAALAENLRARRELHKVIRTAYRKGWSLRRIADATDMSHEQVRTIVRLQPNYSANRAGRTMRSAK